MTSITSGTYPRARSTRTPALRLGLQRLGSSIWQFLCQLGNHRAYPEMMRLSRWYAGSNPALSRQLSEAARNLLKA